MDYPGLRELEIRFVLLGFGGNVKNIYEQYRRINSHNELFCFGGFFSLRQTQLK